MSKEQSKTSISDATNVADEVNNDDSVENTIRSEFVVVTSTTKKKNDGKKKSKNAKKNEDIDVSSNDQNKRRGGPSAAMINSIKQKQDRRKEAELEAEKAAEAQQLLEEEEERQRQEILRLAKERRDKKKEKEKKRIERQKKEGLYFTKQQREKRLRTQVQFQPVGIQIPTHPAIQVTSNNDESKKKGVLYDDQRKTNTASLNISIQLVMPSVETQDTTPIEEKDSSSDSWEQVSVDENIYSEKLHTLDMTEYVESSNDDQESSGFESTENEEDDDDDDQSLSSMKCVPSRLERYHELCESRRSTEVLRAPVICVLGHVDAGKTTMLDNLRQTHVQNGEAGGITQQIGATNVPFETICERTKICRKIISREGDYIVPGLLIIDTPGHEIFKNLRSRGSSLCDLAILVVDLMSGLEQQTLESIQLLTERQTPFIIALNKTDRLYNWKSNNKKDIELVLKEQEQNTRHEFEKRCNDIIVQFAEQGLNVALYYQNPDPNEYYSMVPTSARTGDGMGSLIAMIIELCQTRLIQRISYTNELQATIMEVKSVKGSGTTIDVALVNGSLSAGDKIIIAGQEGPIVTQIQALLIPESNQELRVTNQYEKNNKVQGACGIKIRAKDLEKSMAGLPLFVARKDDEIEYYKNEIETILKTVLNSIQLKEKGVYVQASTLGSLEALLEFLKTSKIPYAGVNIGPIHRKDVMKASAQLEKDTQWATILAFDVNIERDAQEYADSIGVKILQDDKFYSLCDQFIAYREKMKQDNREKHQHLAAFPCKLKILPHCIFNKRDPIICGVRVEDGFIKLGTPICIPSRDCLDIGRVISIEKNHKSLEIAPKGSEVCIQIASINGETPKMYGRHFDANDLLISKISRESIDILKAYFREDMKESDWKLILELKKTFNIL